MASCNLEEQVSFVNKWACAFLINNHPVSLFDIFSVSIPLLVFVWLFSMLFTSRVLRVVCRSLAIAFAFSFFPVVIPMIVLIPIPAWPELLIRDSGDSVDHWWTFYFFLLVSAFWLGLVEYFRHKRDKQKKDEDVQERKRYAKRRRSESRSDEFQGGSQNEKVDTPTGIRIHDGAVDMGGPDPGLRGG